MIIFIDFSGYSDVAIGISRLFGYKIPENFNSPYTKTNISSFWDSWHISLTSWIKDYLFIPLGGSRSGYIRYLLNIFIVFGIVGLWHGAALNFVFWGTYHATGLIIYQVYIKFARQRKEKKNSFIKKILSVFLTFNYVSFGWILFVLPLSSTLKVWSRIFQSKIGLFLSISILICLINIIFNLNYSFLENILKKLTKKYFYLKKCIEKNVIFFNFKILVLGVIISILIYFILIFFSENTTPFVYEQF